jgi:hypothetical protein
LRGSRQPTAHEENATVVASRHLEDEERILCRFNQEQLGPHPEPNAGHAEDQGVRVDGILKKRRASQVMDEPLIDQLLDYEGLVVCGVND